jgi:hypothetical protein
MSRVAAVPVPFQHLNGERLLAVKVVVEGTFGHDGKACDLLHPAAVESTVCGASRPAETGESFSSNSWRVRCTLLERRSGKVDSVTSGDGLQERFLGLMLGAGRMGFNRLGATRGVIKSLACAAPPDLALAEARVLARKTGDG